MRLKVEGGVYESDVWTDKLFVCKINQGDFPHFSLKLKFAMLIQKIKN